MSSRTANVPLRNPLDFAPHQSVHGPAEGRGAWRRNSRPTRVRGLGLDEFDRGLPGGLRGGGQDPAHRPGLRRDPAALPGCLRRRRPARSGRGLPPRPTSTPSSRSSPTAASLPGHPAPPLSREDAAPSSPGALAWAIRRGTAFTWHPERQSGAEGDPAADSRGRSRRCWRSVIPPASSAAATGRSFCCSSTRGCVLAGVAPAHPRRRVLGDPCASTSATARAASSAWSPSATDPTRRCATISRASAARRRGRLFLTIERSRKPRGPMNPSPPGHPLHPAGRARRRPRQPASLSAHLRHLGDREPRPGAGRAVPARPLHLGDGAALLRHLRRGQGGGCARRLLAPPPACSQPRPARAAKPASQARGSRVRVPSPAPDRLTHEETEPSPEPPSAVGRRPPSTF